MTTPSETRAGKLRLDASIIKEASAVLEAVGASGVVLPDNWRWPLTDELAGIALEALAASEPDMRDAYEGAREDLLDWKGRAQRAEARLRSLGWTGIDASEPVEAEPVPMILHCPRCHLQHVDEPDERTPDWTNPPHRSHLCHGCGYIWRPADVATVGVAAIKTKGKADSPAPEQPGKGEAYRAPASPEAMRENQSQPTFMREPQPSDPAEGESLARRFHETYERLAPQFGYETRTETRNFDPSSPNGRLMIAVCTELAALSTPPTAAVRVNEEMIDRLTDSLNESSWRVSDSKQTREDLRAALTAALDPQVKK